MKCPNCFNEIDPKLSECPFCGNVNLMTFELPVLKEEDINNYDGDEKEQSITSVSFDDDGNMEEKNEIFKSDEESLEKDENNIFSEENIDEEVVPKEEDFVGIDKIEPEKKDEFEKTLPDRKKFVSIGLIVVALILLLCLGYFMLFQNNKEEAMSEVDIEVVLTEYREDSKDSKLEKILDSISKKDELEKAQNITKETVSKWIEEDLNKEFEAELDLNNAIDKEKNLLNSIYNYRLKSNSESLLNPSDYSKLLNDIENYRKNNSRYYNALKYYDEGKYNEAYKELLRISSTNVYYKKSQELKKEIISTLIDNLKQEISDLKDKEEILKHFESYCEKYSNVPLNTDDGYVALYNQYK